MKLLRHTILPEFSSQERKVLYILVAIVFILQIGLAFRPLWEIASRPFIDDSFYVFSVSKNIAAGNGITIDGAHLTNGFQPLIAFLYVPMFWLVQNDTVALRLIFIIIATINGLGVVFLAKLIRSLQRNCEIAVIPLLLRPPIVAGIIWGTFHAVTVHTTNGLETGLYSLLLIIDTYVYLRLRHQPNNTTTSWIGFGTLLGITVLARIDSVLLVIIFAAIELCLHRIKGLLPAATICIVAFLISSLWWIYNYIAFGSIMPQSGQAEAIGYSLSLNVSFAATAIANISSVAFFFSPYAVPAWIDYLWLAVMITFFTVFFRSVHAYEYLKTHIDLNGLLALLLFSVFVVCFYVFLFSAPYFLDRYFIPLRIVWIIVTACLSPQFYEYYRSYLGIKKQLFKLSLKIIGCAAIAFNIYGYTHHFFSKPAFLYQAAEWAQQHRNARIGMGQSGIAGFFASNVTNLDGKVNIDALRAMQHSEIGEYVKEKGFDYIADISNVVEPIIISATKYRAIYERTDSVNGVIIFKKKD